ncbi:DmsC/YnfH family molybdoenzyme membrane anchor subunit [Azohydromonas aeria]|uniref:DmsC/YnfH family molybdoenzyme membrane anchor subunit n=1 Tax=Azohydromonas aeria TaxID=2590212 RepID=UPI0012F98D48|nr:DmsC/YnfH family molybdoenzyme membrane anchor subunit [Azohydromonas aeria]
MNPSWSLIAFTVLAGAAQGAAFALALAALAGMAPGAGFAFWTLLIAQALLALALGAAFLHLGRPARAWRAAAMWRTSWMSREVIVLPALMAALAGWSLALRLQAPVPLQQGLAVACVLLCALLWLCTGMIYACLRAVQEWAHPLTVLNFALMGAASGLVLAGALAAAAGEAAFAGLLKPWALALTLLAGAGRVLALWRGARLVPRSTAQSATGLRGARVAQLSMGFTGSSHNTREFFHLAPARVVHRLPLLFVLAAFVLPALLLSPGAGEAGAAPAWLAALALQGAGLLAERWHFFAQVRHPQNLYYQAVA